jgi:hypothetical protein
MASEHATLRALHIPIIHPIHSIHPSLPPSLQVTANSIYVLLDGNIESTWHSSLLQPQVEKALFPSASSHLFWPTFDAAHQNTINQFLHTGEEKTRSPS